MAKRLTSTTPRGRRSSGRALTLAVIPASGAHKREWRISYATIYFLFFLVLSTAALIAFALVRKAPLEAEILKLGLGR